jgi:hypothetical protein
LVLALVLLLLLRTCVHHNVASWEAAAATAAAAAAAVNTVCIERQQNPCIASASSVHDCILQTSTQLFTTFSFITLTVTESMKAFCFNHKRHLHNHRHGSVHDWMFEPQ